MSEIIKEYGGMIIASITTIIFFALVSGIVFSISSMTQSSSSVVISSDKVKRTVLIDSVSLNPIAVSTWLGEISLELQALPVLINILDVSSV